MKFTTRVSAMIVSRSEVAHLSSRLDSLLQIVYCSQYYSVSIHRIDDFLIKLFMIHKKGALVRNVG